MKKVELLGEAQKLKKKSLKDVKAILVFKCTFSKAIVNLSRSMNDIPTGKITVLLGDARVNKGPSGCHLHLRINCAEVFNLNVCP